MSYLGGIIALLLQDHRTMSTKSVCSRQYMVTDQHWATGAQIKQSVCYTGWLKKVSCCTVSTAYFFWATLYIVFSSTDSV